MLGREEVLVSVRGAGGAAMEQLGFRFLGVWGIRCTGLEFGVRVKVTSEEPFAYMTKSAMVCRQKDKGTSREVHTNERRD